MMEEVRQASRHRCRQKYRCGLSTGSGARQDHHVVINRTCRHSLFTELRIRSLTTTLPAVADFKRGRCVAAHFGHSHTRQTCCYGRPMSPQGYTVTVMPCWRKPEDQIRNVRNNPHSLLLPVSDEVRFNVSVRNNIRRRSVPSSR